MLGTGLWVIVGPLGGELGCVGAPAGGIWGVFGRKPRLSGAPAGGYMWGICRDTEVYWGSGRRVYEGYLKGDRGILGLRRSGMWWEF